MVYSFRLFVALLAYVTILCAPAAATQPNVVKHALVEYQPINKKKGLGRLFDWALAKVERVKVSDLLSAFVNKVDHIIHFMVHSFRDLTLSYAELHHKEVERLQQFDVEFKDLVKLRNKIERKCIYADNVDDRSACVDKGIDINSKIIDLKKRRLKCHEAIEWYQDQIEWCASYNNWFC